jgi:acetyl esterase/lipase
LSVFNNISLLGRSAGGGLSLHIALTHQLPVKGLNVACPGVDMKRIAEIIPMAKKDLPIRLSFASKDKKVPIDGPDGGTNLSKLFFDNDYSDFIYLVMSTTSDDDHLNHRLHPILLKNLV